MLQNFIKVAVRNLLKHRLYAFINIMGLAVGMACALFIALFIQDELSYDSFFERVDRIYQVNLNGSFGGEEFLSAATPPPLGDALIQEFPEVETFTRVYRPDDVVLRYRSPGQEEKYSTETRVLGVDQNFLNVFTFTLLEGDRSTALAEPNTVVLTEKTARKYFGNRFPLGQVILLGNDRTPFRVTGVVQNVPSQSSLQFDLLTSVASYPVVKQRNWSWVWCQMNTYVVLKAGAATEPGQVRLLEAKFPRMVEKHAAAAFNRIGQPFNEFRRKGGRWDFLLQPLTEVHLYSAAVSTEYKNLGNIQYIYILTATALFIIILACINFMNLSTARAMGRAREVGVRKVLGSVKNELIGQFLTESVLVSLLAALTALALVALLMAPFNYVTGKTLSVGILATVRFWPCIIALVIITGLLAGCYPAFYLTSFQPILVLKSSRGLKVSTGDRMIRNGLVTFQFAVSIGLIICTLIMIQQTRFIRSKELGFGKENVIVISGVNRLEQRQEAFRQQLAGMPGVIEAGITTSIPAKELFSDFYNPEATEKEPVLTKELTLSSFLVDDHFIPALQINLIAGRNFSRQFADSASVILNEAAVKQIGWREPVGKYLQYPGNDQRFRVIGVMKDFNVESLHNRVTPFALFHASSGSYSTVTSYLVARVKTNDVANTLRSIERQWKGFAPDTPFDYSFLDQEFDALLRLDLQFSVVFSVFTGLSILIACLGLLGLAAFTAEQRTKEISIRKVMGASESSIYALLIGDFLKLILLSIVIAVPVAWYGMHRWLDDYPYRINITWTPFALAGILAVLVALATITLQCARVIRANPLKSLAEK